MTTPEALVPRLAYRPAEAANIIGVSRSQLYELLRTGRLSGRKLGHRTLILRSDLDRFLASLDVWEPGSFS